MTADMTDQKTAPVYRFRLMRSDDFPLIKRWLAEPHVAEWWGNPNEQYELVSTDIDEPAMDQFIVAADDRPFAYIQSCDLAAWPDPAFGEQPRGARGIDQFIGEPDMIARGHGSAFIRVFVDDLLARGAPRVITDPDPMNGRAIRAYEKAGFRRDRIVDTVSGSALLMVR
jgi:aminoglycoside 6'-N-acetyltransferase